MRPDWSKVFDQFIRSYWGCGEDIESDRRNEPKALDSKLVHNELLSGFVSDVSSPGHRSRALTQQFRESAMKFQWSKRGGGKTAWSQDAANCVAAYGRAASSFAVG